MPFLEERVTCLAQTFLLIDHDHTFLSTDHVQTFLVTDPDHTFLLGRQNMYVKNGTNFRNTAVGFFLSLVCSIYKCFCKHHHAPPARHNCELFCQRLQQLLSLNVFHHYASRCSRRYMQPEPTHARRKPMQPIPVPKVSCRFLKNVLRAWPKRFC